MNRTTVYLPVEMIAKLDSIADGDLTSRGAVIRLMLKDKLGEDSSPKGVSLLKTWEELQASGGNPVWLIPWRR